MKNPALVGKMHGPRDQRQETGGPPNRQGPAPDGLRQGTALDQLHGQEVLAVVLADVVDGNNVGMIQPRGGLSLHAKAPHFGRRSQLAGTDHLQRHRAVETNLSGSVYDSHPALGQLLKQVIVA